LQSSVNVDLSRFENSFYQPASSWLIRGLWFFIGLPLLRCSILPSSSFRRSLLRLFGADIGRAAVIKPGFRVKYPWNLKAGKNCWFGEDAWVDNLDMVWVGDNVCISQGAYLCTGNHDWADPAFGLIVRPIRIQDGAWVGARASVSPGVVIGEGAVVGLGAVITKPVPAFEIHAGNPAKFVRRREIR
jgi:putative colanic acid biosynthesis acetyltransferase WcaF